MLIAMSFMNLSALIVMLPLLIIPLAVHLYNKKFPHKLAFSDIRMIRKSMEQRSKLFRLRHIILMVLRTLAVLLLLFCFLQPLLNIFGADDDKNGSQRTVILVLDHSLSMNYRGGGMTSGQRALIEVEKIVDSLAAADKVNLICLERQAKLCFDEAGLNHSELLAYANSLTPSASNGDINQAIYQAERQLRKAGGSGEVYFISDFQRSNWGRANLEHLKGKARLFFVDVSATVTNNRAIIGAEVLDSSILAGSSVPVDISIANHSENILNDRMEVRIDDKESLFFDVDIAAWRIQRIRVEIPIRTRGVHEIKALLTADDLPEDNTFYFTLEASDKEEVMLLTDTDAERSSGNFLIQAALNPYKNLAGALLPKLVASQALAPLHLASTSKMFISGIERLGDEQLHLINKFISEGGSAVYFLDGDFDAENLRALQKVLPVELPFQIGLKQTSKNIPGGRIKIRSGHFESKYLGLFRGEARKRLGNLDFYEYYQARSGSNGRILLSYSEGTPAMASCSIGLGQLLLCNFSIEESASNLAAQKIFPAWIQEIAANMARESRQLESFEVEDKLQKEVWLDEMRQNHFVSPDGRRQKIKTHKITDKRLLVEFTPLKPGHYSLKKKDALLHSFAVNCNAEEADLRQIDLDSLPSRNGVEAFQVKGKDEYEQVQSGQKVFHWFLLACMGFLFTELFLFQLFRRLAK
ncbi:MAG: VWA domain-containing protein [Lentisphaeraceae bacterium]|nr:VWA domain-containing protein [Lentisphaeraceae bacterium]